MPSDAAASLTGGFVVRFTATERLLHWVHAAGFLVMFATGLLLYLPSLSDALGGRPQAKAIHLGAAVVWLTALAVVALLGNRPALRRTMREIDRLDIADRAWLRGKPVAQGRFNAGQKLHTVIQSAFAALFAISGILLWLGLGNNDLRLPGTIVVHDGTMYLAVALLIGHLWLALVWPSTRHAMRGIIRGTVRASWAARRHAGWRAELDRPPPAARPGPRRLALAAALVALGVAATSLAVGEALGGGARDVPPAVATSPPSPPTPPARPDGVPDPAPGTPGLQLATEAQALERSGALDAAIVRYRRAVRALPARADIRTALGLALARAGNTRAGVAQLRRAIRARSPIAESRLYLGLTLQAAGRRPEAVAQLRRYLRGTETGPGADLARDALRGS